MGYPYPSLLPVLQFHCTPDEYRQVIAPHISRWRGGIAKDLAGADYWRIIPAYTYAECPVCHVRYCEPADTYSIRGWGSYDFLLDNLYVSKSYYPVRAPCPHFLGIHAFINLHDELPGEIEDMVNHTGEVPYITPWNFPEGLESYAVLHALPICRIENDEFVPRYTVFSLTYFSGDLELLYRHFAAKAKAERVHEDPEYYPSTVWGPGHVDQKQYNESLYDLAAWAERGQLGWLDVAEAELPLRVGVGLQLPELYRHIEGKRWLYLWEKGSIRPWRWY